MVATRRRVIEARGHRARPEADQLVASLAAALGACRRPTTGCDTDGLTDATAVTRVGGGVLVLLGRLKAVVLPYRP